MEFNFKAADLIKEGRISSEELHALKKWVKDDEKLPEIRDEMLALFMISCGDDKELVHSTIHSYFRTKNATPVLFNDKRIDLPELQTALECIEFLLFPKRTDDNYVILYFRLTEACYTKFNVTANLKICNMLVESLMYDYPPDGIVTIVDMERFSFTLLPKINISILAKFNDFLQEGLPFKLGTIHMLNCSFVVKPFMKLMQLCTKSEILDQFVLHPRGIDSADLFETCLPARLLPADYGGDLPSLQELQARSIHKLKELKSFLQAEEELRNLYRDKS